jgi:hypothetical protein
MRDNHSGSPLIPDFLSSPSTDQQQDTSGSNHVVGIILCHDLWNSGMRNDNGIEQVKYLHGLARLQHALRKHNTRYGFIITEIELVCVKYGGDDIIAQQCVPGYSFSLQSPHFIPILGYFEVSPAIPLSHNYKFPNRDLKMTAGLALWYLHMLAREQPLPGNLHWRIEGGTAHSVTRQKYMVKDPWVPRGQIRETRRVKLFRGREWPEDKLKETQKRKRTVSGKKST